jgi:uncharacterized protein YijF (DUF1287 family)
LFLFAKKLTLVFKQTIHRLAYGETKSAANKGFCASVAGRTKHQQQITIQLLFQLDAQISTKVHNFNFSFSINSGYGQMERYFHTCTKP